MAFRFLIRRVAYTLVLTGDGDIYKKHRLVDYLEI
jgi:hypothetical protein